MRDPDALNDVELLVLLAVARLAEAYGVTVRDEIERTANRSLSLTAVYGALERLEERGFLEGALTRPTPERGGRRKRVYQVLPPGAEAALRARRGLERMWDGIPTPEPGTP